MNSNVLEGMACPSCGSEGPFQIAFAGLGSFSDDGGPIRISALGGDHLIWN